MWRKIVCVFFLVVLLAQGLPFQSFALSTRLVTHVPDAFSLELKISGNGTVWVGDTAYYESAIILLDRRGETMVNILPNENNNTRTVVFNGKSVISNIKNGKLILPALEKDSVLSIRFARDSTIPNTGDQISRHFFSMTAAAFGIIYLIVAMRATNKKREQF